MIRKKLLKFENFTVLWPALSSIGKGQVVRKERVGKSRWIMKRNCFPLPFFLRRGLPLFLLSVLVICACHRNKEAVPSSAFFDYVKAYTGGIVGEDAAIRVELAFDAPVLSAEVASGLFDFSPSLKGTVRRVSSQVWEFVPEKGRLRPGEVYRASFRIGDLADMPKKEMRKFRFSFRVASRQCSFRVDDLKIRAGNPEQASVSGTLALSRPLSEEEVGRIFHFRYPEKGAQLKWSAEDGGKVYRFEISPLVRGAQDRLLELESDGSAWGFSSKQEETVGIPGRGRFAVLQTRVSDTEDPYVEVLFTEALDPEMDPEGLFRLESGSYQYFKMEDNRIRIYYERTVSGRDMELRISSSVKSHAGKTLGEDFVTTLSVPSIKPAVELPSGGGILPDAGHRVFPFRAVNLKAVDLKIIRIYEDNILMFLQDNDWDGNSQLRRSGRLVYARTLHLDEMGSGDLHRWQDFSIDLSSLFQSEPGALYQLRFSFRPEYSLYGQEHSYIPSDAARMVPLQEGSPREDEEAVWDLPEAYYYDNYYDWSLYEWSQRDNPLHPSYYMESERMPFCNVLSSNLGLIAKSADRRTWTVTVNHILNTGPVDKAEVTAYNFQLREIGKAETGRDGFASLQTRGDPFVIVAEKDLEKSYLKVSEGKQNNLSRFDVGGMELEEGLKGFVYGERGVWRPGDTLHLSLILEDKGGRLPGSYPVSVELYTPQGQFYAKQVNARPLNGFYVFHLPTRMEDPTGTWNAYFKAGGATFHKALPLETVKPNRLKIELESGERILHAGNPVRMRLHSRWLTGSDASNLDAAIRMNLQKETGSFPGYGDYVFSDPASSFTYQARDIWKGKLDGKGRASVDLAMPAASGAPGRLRAQFLCQVTEPGGDVSLMSYAFPFSPYPAYVGVRIPEGEDGQDFLETDRDYRFDLVVLDADGKKCGGHRLQYSIYKLDWTWWWESRDRSLDSYVNGTSAKAVASGIVKAEDGTARIPFRVDYPQWGRFLVYVKDLESGHASGGIVHVDWPSWRGRSSRPDPDGLAMLTFSTDKKNCRVGENLTVYVPACQDGRALLCVENARGVVSRTWVETAADKETPYSFTVTPEMSPNAYIHISLLQPYRRTDNDLPLRLYGVQPFGVDDPRTVLEPVLKMPSELHPLQSFDIAVSERQNRPMTYTLAIVDEGLLDLTSFKTPDPWAFMYAREALGVNTWDMYDAVMGAYSGRFAPMFSVGGDQALLQRPKRENRFNPVVAFYGPFELEKGVNRHTVRLPMYTGSVRVMLVAAQDGAYGKTEKTVPVTSPLMVLASLPRVLATGDDVVLPVNVFASGLPANTPVRVETEAEGPVRWVSGKMQETVFAGDGDRMLRFRFRTLQQEGPVRFRIRASGGGKTAVQEVSIRLRNPNPPEIRSQSMMLSPGEEHAFSYEPFVSDGEQWARLEWSGLPMVDARAFFEFVSDYPHACSEQLSARGIAFLYLKEWVGAAQQEKIRQAVPEILRELYKRQLPNGGFCYWPQSAHADEWVTSMAGQFMVKAAQDGYSVNSGVMAAWSRFQQEASRNYRSSSAGAYSDLNQAYRLYVLALSGQVQNGAMNRMKEKADLDESAAWRLTAAYAVAGKKDIARAMAVDLKSRVEDYASGGSYGSALREKAMRMESMALSGDIPAAMRMAVEVARGFSSPSGYTTQNTAFAAIAMDCLAKSVNASALKVSFSQGESGGEILESAKSSQTRMLDTRSGKAVLKNLSQGGLFVNFMQKKRLPPGSDGQASSSGISIRLHYYDSDGREISPEVLHQGSDFEVLVTVSNLSGKDLCNLALTYPWPSGWEAYPQRLYGEESAGSEAYGYRDVRDDRMLCYFDLPAGTRKSFRIRLRAAYEGRFLLPSVSCQAMYDAAVYARTASSGTEVIR